MTAEDNVRTTDSNIQSRRPDCAGDKAAGKVEQRIKTAGSISRRRLWLFRLVAATVIPAVVLLAIEISLRIVGYGYSASAFRKTTLNGQASYCENYQFGRRFWPRTIAREFEPFIFAARKPAETYRIFILGGSAALGTPEPSYSFARCLEVMLRNQYPQVNFEVINIAITAANSHVVLPIARDCVRHGGNLFVVYLGNNEVIGPYGAGTIFAPLSDNMNFIRFDKAMQTTRIGQLLKNSLQTKQSQKTAPATWAGTAMFMENLIREDDADLDVVYKHFRKNLEDIAGIIRKGGADAILCSVGGNIKDCPPFASLHRTDLTDAEKEKWDNFYRQGAEHAVSGDNDLALQSYLAAGDIDSAYAELHFRIARAYEQSGLFEKARIEYILARQSDALRLRADNRINQIVREVAESFTGKGVYFVDSVKTFEENSLHDTPGEELFYEHVHLNFKGNYVLAETVFRRIEDILPTWIKSQRAALSIISRKQCAERLAYTEWDKYRITQKLLGTFLRKAPFTNRLDNDALVRHMEQNAADLRKSLDYPALESIQKQYVEAIRNAPSDWWLHWKYARFLTDVMKKPQGAAEQYRIVTELMPGSYLAHATYGLSLLKLGNADAAVIASQKALRIRPDCADAYHVMGVSCLNRGDTDNALKHFSREVQIRPDHAQGYNRMAIILDGRDEPDKAEEVYRKGLTFAAGDVTLNYNFALFLARQKRFDEAAEVLQLAQKANPSSPQLLMLLNKVRQAGKLR
ncbi:MAG: hypothetical protein DRP66_01525 [Planctomycetota bacterium]|nr:MAG: hypothetical protein DRP66_01525 [Planctomycetota bacterium]